MNAILSDELARAIDAQGDLPLRAMSPTTGKQYVVVSEELYERLKPLFENVPISSAEQQFLLGRVGIRAGWDEPNMDAYDDYDQMKSRQQ